ncbi:hypothetical protein C2W62_31360 [Candidatus Entotheonella serta]|nr:hypothetical protein C2W62_31360 [Candidatus Entotheonella serta]
MNPNHLTHNRYGALALGLSALLFAVFPLVRPFFPLDPSSPVGTLAVASPAVTSTPWIGAHMGLMIAFVLLVYGVLALYCHLATSPLEPRARRAVMWSLAGIVLIMPMLGVEVHILPILGELYLDGQTGIAPAVGHIYLGPAIGGFLVGLIMLAIGAITFASAIWHSEVLPRWAGVCFAIGLALWFPPFPRMIRTLDGFLIGVGGIWLAWGIWQMRDRRYQGFRRCSTTTSL